MKFPAVQNTYPGGGCHTADGDIAGRLQKTSGKGKPAVIFIVFCGDDVHQIKGCLPAFPELPHGFIQLLALYIGATLVPLPGLESWSFAVPAPHVLLLILLP